MCVIDLFEHLVLWIIGYLSVVALLSAASLHSLFPIKMFSKYALLLAIAATTAVADPKDPKAIFLFSL